MTTYLTSFAELAKVFKCEKKAHQILQTSAFLHVEDTVGRKAAVVWAWLNDREANKRSGERGSILHSPQAVAAGVGYTTDVTVSCLLLLCKHGWARPTQNNLVKAA